MSDAPALAALLARVEAATGASIADRFWSRVERKGVDECWPWTSYRSPRKNRRLDYGIFAYAKGKVARAHRMAFELERGPIPPGMCVCHTCDNPWCCNPAHLWLGTVAENNRDREAKGRTINPRKSPCLKGEAHPAAKLTNEQVARIRRDTRSCSVIARELDVNPTTVWKIRTGVSWREQSHG